MAEARKYHISKKTGKAALCKATVKPCPVGGPEAHFPTREAAEAHIASEEAASHALFSPKNTTGVKALADLKELVEQGEVSSALYALREKGFTVTRSIEAPDYRTVYLVQRDGHYYSVACSKRY